LERYSLLQVRTNAAYLNIFELAIVDCPFIGAIPRKIDNYQIDNHRISPLARRRAARAAVCGDVL
jgi:hypothetical protein